MEHQPITIENFAKVLELNGWKPFKELAVFKGRILTKDDYELTIWGTEWNLGYIDRSYSIFHSCEFALFLVAFEAKFGKLNPLPVKDKFRPYWNIFKEDLTYLNILHADIIGLINNSLVYSYDELRYQIWSLLEDKIKNVKCVGAIYPIQNKGKESNFSIILLDGKIYKAIWHGEEK